jgi:hypothetical protein
LDKTHRNNKKSIDLLQAEIHSHRMRVGLSKKAQGPNPLFMLQFMAVTGAERGVKRNHPLKIDSFN